MPTEQIGEYVIEYAGEPLKIGAGWGAYLTVYAISPNPAFRNALFPKRRVRVDLAFPTQTQAEECAHDLGVSKVTRSSEQRRA